MGSLIFDLIEQIPLSLELRNKSLVSDIKTKEYELKFMELIRYFLESMLEKEFKVIVDGTLNQNRS